MKTILKSVFCILCPVLLLASCQKENLVFDHEQPQFEIRENAILLEFIAPTGTAADEEIYIFGAFNGEDEKSVIGKVEWQLEKAANSDKKWGIYLFPDEFKKGKTLVDGFSFASNKSGGERDIKGNAVSHTDDAKVGTRTNIWAERWAKFFTEGTEEITHNGYVIFVWDESGFEDLSLYMYGDINDLNGEWPGMKPTGTQTINNREYTYFDMGEMNTGLSETLIFSDNGNNQLADYGPVILSEDIYLHINADGTIEKISESDTQEHDGAVVYVLDGIGWGMATTLYMWGDVNDLNGGWPGMAVKGTTTIGEYIYLYYDLGADNAGLKESLIFSNSGKSQLGDYPGNNQFMTIGEDIYLYITQDGITVIEDPENPGDVTWFDPKPETKEEAKLDLYFYDLTDTLTRVIDTVALDTSFVPLHIYAWGDSELFGGWPGASFASFDTLSLLGIKLIHAHVDAFVGDNYHLIINNGNDRQLKDYDIQIGQAKDEIYLKLTDAGVVPLEIAVKAPRR